MPAFALLYALRVPQEERSMAERFGAAYLDYMRQTGRLWPRSPMKHA